MLEGDFDYGPFPVRRIALDDVLDDFICDQDYRTVVGTAREGQHGQVVNLNVGRKVADPELAGMPHLASGITFQHEGRMVLATPNLKDAAVSVIDMSRLDDDQADRDTWAGILHPQPRQKSLCVDRCVLGQ